MIKKIFPGMIALAFVSLLLTGCPSSSSSPSNGPTPDITGSIAVSVPNGFPYNVAQTITVELSSNNSSDGGDLGFSNLALHTSPENSLNLLTISPSSTCLAISENSTATSCTFIVTNNSSSGEPALNSSGYYVTGQLAGSTVTSNLAYPANVPPPPGNYWTVSINNETGANQYFFVFGQNLQTAGNPYEVVVFDGNHYGTAHSYSPTTNYGSDENSLILTPGVNTIHIPYGIYGGRAYLSNHQMVGLELDSSGGIVTPSFTAANNPNYSTIFDDFEFTYAADIVSGVSHAVVNQTQVDALGVPLCIQGTSNYSPIDQAGFCNISRASLLSSVTTAFDAIGINDPGLENQWNSTVLRDGSSNILRIMNPGSADVLTGTAPISSFSTYLEPYIAQLVASNDYSANNSLQVSLDGIAVISGKIVPASGNTPATYTFSCTGGICDSQSGTMPLTSASLLNGAPPGAVNMATTLAYEMISSAFMAGQLPPTQQSVSSIITQTYLRGLNPVTFYESNSGSNASAYQYSVFSNALRGVQLDGTYTFPYNDVLGVSSTMTQTLTGPTNEPDPITVTVRY